MHMHRQLIETIMLWPRHSCQDKPAIQEWGLATCLASRCNAPKLSLEPDSIVTASKVDCLGKSWGTTKQEHETELAAQTDNATETTPFSHHPFCFLREERMSSDPCISKSLIAGSITGLQVSVVPTKTSTTFICRITIF